MGMNITGVLCLFGIAVLFIFFMMEKTWKEMKDVLIVYFLESVLGVVFVLITGASHFWSITGCFAGAAVVILIVPGWLMGAIYKTKDGLNFGF
jgi:hypothetical protein